MYFVIRRRFKKFDTRLFLFYSSVFFVLTFMVFFFVNFFHINLSAIQVAPVEKFSEPGAELEEVSEVTIQGGGPTLPEQNPGSGVDGSSLPDGASGSSDNQIVPDVIVGEQVQEFEIIVPRIKPSVVPEDFIESNNLGTIEVNECGQILCEEIQSCSTQSNTDFSLVSREISSGLFKKSFCTYENSACEGKFLYEKCDYRRQINLEIQPSFALASSGIAASENAESSSQRVVSSGKETKIVISDSETADSLVSVSLNSKERKLSLSLGNSPEAPSYCYNGEKDPSEERIDCGFICNKPCGEDDSLLGILRLVSWWIFLILFGLLMTEVSRRK